ncbi:hypothetical protein D3C78_1969180 [compost metagenome]
MTASTISGAVELPSKSVMKGAISCDSIAARLWGRISMSMPITRPRPMALHRLA